MADLALPPGARAVLELPKGAARLDLKLPPAAPAAPPSPAEPEGVLETVNANIPRVAQAGASGFNTGLANMLGIPVDLLGAGMKELGLLDENENPVGGSESIKSLFRMIGVPDFKAETFGERLSQRIGEEVGSAVPTLGVPLGIAARAPAVASRAAPSSVAGGVGRDIVAQTAARPGLAAGVEAASAVGGGTGAGLVKEATDDPTAEFGGTLGGAVAGSALAGGVGGAGRMLLDRLKKMISGEAVGVTEGRVGKALLASADDPDSVVARLDESIDALQRGDIPTTPTLGQIADDTGIDALIRGSVEKSPETRGAVRARESGFRDVLQREAADVEPQGSPNTIGEAIQSRRARLEGAFDDQISSAQARADARAAKVPDGPGARATQNQVVREELEDALGKAREQETALFNEIDPTGETLINTDELKKAVDDAQGLIRKADRADTMPEVAQNIRELDGTESIDELMSLRSRLLDDARAERASGAVNGKRLKILNDLQDSVLKTLDNQEDAFINADAKARYDVAREFSKTLNDKFTRGATGRILKSNAQGGAKVPLSSTVDSFFKSGRGAKEDAEQLVAALGSRPRATEAVRDYATRRALDFATDQNGNIRPEKLQTWINKHEAPLEQFPEVLREVGDIAALQGRAGQLAGRKGRSLDSLDKSAARFFLDAEPDIAVADALKSKKPTEAFKRLKSLLQNDPEAVQGVRRGLFERLGKSVDSDVAKNPVDAILDNPQKAVNFLGKNEAAFKEFYTPEEFNRIKTIARLAERFKNVSTGASPKSIPDKKSVLSLNQLLSRLYGIQRGVVSSRFVAGEVGSRVVNAAVNQMTRKQASNVLQKALVDPAFARRIMGPQVEPLQAVQAIRGHLLGQLGGEDKEQ